MVKYSKPLNVSNTKGQRIVALVYPIFNDVVIKLPYIEEVEKDNPSFAYKGIITIKCIKSKYKNVVVTLTQYLEDLFLKGIANEDIYTSLGITNVKGRNDKQDSGRKTTKIEGSRNTASLYPRPGRVKPPENSRTENN